MNPWLLGTLCFIAGFLACFVLNCWVIGWLMAPAVDAVLPKKASRKAAT